MTGISRVLFAFSGGVLALATLQAQAPAAAAGAVSDSSTETKLLVEKTCTSCHVISQVSSQHRTADQWAATVDQMIGYGAQVSDANYPKIVDYLAHHYGPEGAAKE